MLDWTDSELLREMLRRRIVFSSDLPKDADFLDVWRQIVVSTVQGEESSQFLIDRSLMRPRNLLDLVNHCKGFAVNLNHSKIDVGDIDKGLAAYSNDLLHEFDREVRDVVQEAEGALYAFIDAPFRLTADELRARLQDFDVELKAIPRVVDTLLWYGVLGLVNDDDSVTYIYHVGYNSAVLHGMRRKLEKDSLHYEINPAFWKGLHIAH